MNRMQKSDITKEKQVTVLLHRLEGITDNEGYYHFFLDYLALLVKMQNRHISHQDNSRIS